MDSYSFLRKSFYSNHCFRIIKDMAPKKGLTSPTLGAKQILASFNLISNFWSNPVYRLYLKKHLSLKSHTSICHSA